MLVVASLCWLEPINTTHLASKFDWSCQQPVEAPVLCLARKPPAAKMKMMSSTLVWVRSVLKAKGKIYFPHIWTHCVVCGVCVCCIFKLKALFQKKERIDPRHTPPNAMTYFSIFMKNKKMNVVYSKSTSQWSIWALSFNSSS